MTRVQLLLDTKEIHALRQQARATGKSHSQLVREAIDNTYLSPWSDVEIAKMAKEAKSGKGLKTFRDLQAARRYLWSL